jgi:hypothetical protein
MSKRGERQPADVLPTKRLEIVDNEDKVRAALETNQERVTSLSGYDRSERLRSDRRSRAELPLRSPCGEGEFLGRASHTLNQRTRTVRRTIIAHHHFEVSVSLDEHTLTSASPT